MPFRRALPSGRMIELVAIILALGTLLPSVARAVTVSELMYHPVGDNPDNEQYGEEFIELFNETATSINLGGYHFTRGISGANGEQDYTLPANTVLASGEYLVLAREPAAMLARGVPRVIGPYGGHLKNTGERLTLVDAGGSTVIDFTFSDRGDWPAAGDGTGHSIVLNEPADDPDRGRNWHHSQMLGGSPGRADVIAPSTLYLVTAPDLKIDGCPAECSRSRYFKGTQEPPSTWKNIGFDDASWLVGCGGWGYGDADDCTELNDMRGQYISVYARVGFNLTAEQISWMRSLTLDVRYDDGFVAYLNGNASPLDRDNVAGTPPPYYQAAGNGIEPITRTTDLTARINLLQPGVNVLALQGHNVDKSSSSDFSLIARLTAVIQPPSVESDPARQIVINEIFADGSGAVWAELYNPGDQSVGLGGVWLSNDEDNLAMEALPAQAAIGAKGWLLLQKGTDFNFSIRTSASGGQLFLTSASRQYVLAAYAFGPQHTGQSIGRFPDGAPDWHYMDHPTPNTANQRHRLSPMVINEIQYHAPQGEPAEYVEIHNTGTSTIDISGWEFAGIGYRFPDKTKLAADGYAAVCDDRTAAAQAYGIDVETLFGDYHGNLSNGGEKIVLIDENDLVVDWVDYADAPPWPVTPDGTGSSLERRCASDSFDQPSDWIGSPVGAPTPGAVNHVSTCTIPATPLLVINEIMPHPYAELHDGAKTEFIEIYNASGGDVDLTDWRLGGDVDFAMPAGRTLAANGYLVASSDPSAGRAAEGGLYRAYTALSDLNTVGPYAPDLPNGGADVWLIGPDGRIVDAVHYSDDFPWPSAADGYGAIEGRGRSLQRRCATAASDAPANWEVSAADLATPGKVNTNNTCTLPATVVALGVTPSPVVATSTPMITATIAPYASVTAASLQYFVDNIQTTGEPVMSLAMANSGNGSWKATLPAQAGNSIVRYRILLNTGSGLTVVSPRPAGDVYGWHAYFVNPPIDSPVPLLHLFISPANWRLMYDNASPGRVIGSTLNPRWDDEVPAVFVADGQVYDVSVRFQGSRWNRLGGGTIGFACPSYSSDQTAQVLSWRVRFPSYRNYNKMDVIDLQKQSGWPQRISFKMFELAGVPAPVTSWGNLHINGCSYNDYVYKIERPGADLVRRWFGSVGDLFKSQGFTGDEGPWSWGDERLIVGALNGYSEEDRYEYTYDRETLNWKNRPGDGQSDVVEPMIEGLHAARAQGAPALRAYLAANFDVDRTLRYIATINYVGTFDDMFQNHFLYRRADDGKWCMFPWDMDNTLGGAFGEYNAHWLRGSDRSDVGNREGWWNRLKDSFFKAYEPEYVSMLLYLNNEVYPPDVMNPIIDEIAAERGVNGADIKNFIQARHDWLNANVVIPVCKGDPAVVDGTLGAFTIQGPDQAVVNRATQYTIQAALAGSTAVIDVLSCVQWSSSRPDITTITAAGRVTIKTASPPDTLDLIATLSDSTGIRTASKTITLVAASAAPIDLGQIAGGGDGVSPGLNAYAGINMVDGQFEPTHYNGGVGDAGTQPQLVPAPPGADYDLVDSVFILHSDVAINQAGVLLGVANWTGPANPFSGGSYDFILDNLEPGDGRPLRLRENGAVVAYTGGLGMHASAGITYDLAALARYTGTELLRFQSRFGVHAEAAGSVEGFAIFSNDHTVLSFQRSGVKRQSDNAYVFDLSVPATARYLTLATGSGGDGIGSDHGVWGDAIILTRVYVPSPFDYDGDRDVDAEDLSTFAACVSGPGIPAISNCAKCDRDGDGDVDQDDFGAFQRGFTGAPAGSANTQDSIPASVERKQATSREEAGHAMNLP